MDYVLPEYKEAPIPQEALDGEIVIDYLNQLDIINDAIRSCNRAIDVLTTRLHNRVFLKNLKGDKAKDIVNPDHVVSENLEYDLSIALEDSGSNIFVRIWEAIKNFFKKIYRWLFGFKAVTKRYFANMDKNIKQHLDLVRKMARECRGDLDRYFNMDLLDKEEITLNFHMRGGSTLLEMMEHVSTIFDNMVKYIKDPERNQEAMLRELEKDSSANSFHQILGVTIITNEKEQLGPSRIETLPLKDLYEEKKGTLNNFGLLNSKVFMMLDAALERYQSIARQTLALEETFISIQNSYDTLDKELKNVDKKEDFISASRRTRVLLLAKDHIAKSKALIEAFVSVYNVEVKNITTVVDILHKAFKK